MDTPPAPAPPSAPLVDAGGLRTFFGIAGMLSLLAAVVHALLPVPADPLLRGVAVGACLLLAAHFLGTRAWLHRLSPVKAVLAAAWVSLVAVFAITWALGWGLRTPQLAFLGIVVCAVSAMAIPRAARQLAVVSAIGVSALAVAELTRNLPGATSSDRVLLDWWVNLLVLAAALAAGNIVGRHLRQTLMQASDREARFRGLLRVAVDRYWETDADCRFTLISDPRDAARDPAAHALVGLRPWEVRNFGFSDDQADAARADMEARRSFSGLLAVRRGPDGRVRHFSHAGEPRFGQNGAFLGYWGVGREVTAEMQAQQAMLASEARYRHLFERSPSPFLLHRHGRVIEGNEAAARLFGLQGAEQLPGFDLFAALSGAEERRRAEQRNRQLQDFPLGVGLPVAEYQMRDAQGKALSVQSTAVQVETAGGTATLSIFFDTTARKATEAALRRSEAMLSHLFATTPDLVALTEARSGRFVMVNPGFCRAMGYAADEVLGRTAEELGTWKSLAERDRLLRRLHDHGKAVDFHTVFVAKGGVGLQMMISAARFTMGDRDYLVLSGRDITTTERARVEYEAILQRASIGIAFTRDRRFVRANPLFERMFGWEPGARVGAKDAAIWADEADLADMDRHASPLLAAGQGVDIERQMRRRDGSSFWCRLMAQALDRNDPEHGGTIWIAEDVTQRRQVDQALSDARDAAESASRAKSAFLANTSHEIRTPLNGMLGLARLALQDELEAPRRRQYLTQIMDSAQSLAGIISDILDLSKIEAGKITIESVAFGLHELLQGIHHTYAPLAQARGLALSLQIADDVPLAVRGDPVRLRQIVTNYLTNALKFTAQGEIRIDAAIAAAGQVRLTVHDSGEGIAEATQARLFTPFTQGDESTTRRFGGTGLGLSICRELARLMGGTVGVRSTEGAGSSFWAELPLPAADADEAAAAGRIDDPAALQGLRVLIVEDNPVNMMIAAAMLEQWGVEVVQAVDGSTAIVAVSQAVNRGRPVDLVLMDVQMPGMSGHEAARRLRQRFDARTLPIVALTAAALVSEREEALAAGMNDFLTKPVDTGKLRAALLRCADMRNGALLV